MTENAYQSPEPQQDAQQGSDNLRSAFTVSGVIHVFLLFGSALVLDGGRLSRLCIIGLIAYWAVILVVLARRRDRLGRLDFFFIRYGTLGLCAFSPWIREFAYFLVSKIST